MPDAKVSLAAKLADVMGEMAHIKKEGFNKAQNYRYVRESDVAEKASELLAAKHIWIHQTVVKEKMTPLYTTASGSQMWLTKLTVAFTFIDGDTDERTEPQFFVGYGADTGDKGVYKAMTGAEKYFLMKSFLVSTGDDPEADEKVDKGAEAASAAKAPRVVRGNQAGVQRGGKSATATRAQVDEIARLVKGLNLTQETVLPIIMATFGHVPEGDMTLRAFLGERTGDEAAKLISVLMEFKPLDPDQGLTSEDVADIHSESTDVEENAVPETMAVV